MAGQEPDLDRYNDRVELGTPLASFASWAVVAPVPTLRVALGIMLEELGRRTTAEDVNQELRGIAEIIRDYRKARDVDESNDGEIDSLLALQEALMARWPEVGQRLPGGL